MVVDESRLHSLTDLRFAGNSSRAKYYDFDKDFLLELEPCSTVMRSTTGNPQVQRIARGIMRTASCASAVR
jgi:hypothetical protein